MRAFKLKEKKGLTVSQLSALLGISERYAYKVLKLANLPKEMVFDFENKQISVGELIKIRSLPEEKQLFGLRQIIRSSEKPKMRYMPKDILRAKGFRVGPSFGVVGGRGESMKHFIIKCVIFKILKDLKRHVGCEVEVEGAVADVVDLGKRHVYEVETSVSPERVRKKINDFKAFNDVFIIDVGKVPDDVCGMERYLRGRVL